MKPTKPSFSLNFQAMRRIIYKQPKGVVLVVSPFNYPLWLGIGPAVRIIVIGQPDYIDATHWHRYLLLLQETRWC